RARSPHPPRKLPQLATGAPRRTQTLEPAPVEDVERGKERALGTCVVREPPRRPEPAALAVDVLDAHALVQPVLRARPPEARRLDAAPRRLTGRERVAEVVDPHHARVEPPRDAVGLREIARPDARTEPVRAVVRTADRVVLTVERLDGDDRAEELLVGQRPRDHGRLQVPAVAVRPPYRREPLDTVALALRDERAELERARALGQTPEKLVVERPLDVDPLGAHARLPCVQERREERTLDGPIDIRIREDDERIPAAELERDRAAARARGRGDAPADLHRAREEDLGDPRVADERRAGLRLAGHDLH